MNNNEKLFLTTQAAINTLWNDLNCPKENDGRDTTTETCGFTLAEYNEDSDDHIKIVDEYNHRLEILAKMIDKRHIGSNIWYTSAYSTPEFDRFAELATPHIHHFIAEYEW